jgi:hypothetical protein
MWFHTRYDDKEIECQFCHKKVKPIIERNAMDIGLGMPPGPFLEEQGPVLLKNQKGLF